MRVGHIKMTEGRCLHTTPSSSLSPSMDDSSPTSSGAKNGALKGSLISRFICGKSRMVIPAYRRCDGVRDCHDGEDEVDCHRSCKDYGMYCIPTSGYHHMMTNGSMCLIKSTSDLMCNGIVDCIGGVDEDLRLCQPVFRRMMCKNQCQNDGECMSDGSCVCKVGFRGKRCQESINMFTIDYHRNQMNRLEKSRIQSITNIETFMLVLIILSIPLTCFAFYVKSSSSPKPTDDKVMLVESDIGIRRYKKVTFPKRLPTIKLPIKTGFA